MAKRVTSLDELLRRFEKDPEFRREYRRQTPYHDLLRAIVRRRKELRMTQAELARKAGTHQSRISRIENGEYDVQISTLVDIAEALGVRVELRFVPFYETGEKRWEKLVTIPAVARQSSATYSQEPAEERKVVA